MESSVARFFSRLLEPPTKTFLLLGPRGTGKSTWLSKHFPKAFRIDLLHTEQLYRYRSNPSLIRSDLAGLRSGEWAVIDEAQKVPDLLDEIHGLYESRHINFAITGSSARKLRRADVNLLGGRAIRCDFFPLAWAEIKQAALLEACLDYGTLPPVLSDPSYAADTLASYVGTYLQEEVAAEALTRNVQPFARFLQVAARHHAQVLNVERVAQQAAVKRRTVDTYFEILEDTLLGIRLPAYRPGFRSKEAAHPKFYFFDAGVARAAAGWIRETMPDEWRGFSFETLVLGELRAFNSYRRKDRRLFHYSVTGAFDIDFVVETKKKVFNRPARFVAIEAKASSQWRSEWNGPLATLSGQGSIDAAYGVYLGQKTIVNDTVTVLPFAEFSRRLWSGDIF
jgi:predicted AAA+ superfamily ATPase